MAKTITSQHKRPKKGLRIAHINTNSLRNKINEVTNLLHKLHIHAVWETHLKSSFEDSELYIKGFICINEWLFIFRITCLWKSELIWCTEILWLQVHRSHLKPILLGCCYRPPSPNNDYIDTICKMVDNNTVVGQDIYLMGDFDTDWFTQNCPLKDKLQTATNTCEITQVINKPTRICVR